MPLIYEPLRGIAARELRRERRDHTLDATAVVHEAYLRLCHAHGLRWESRGGFFAFATFLIRRVLVDHARRKGCAKRGGQARRVSADAAGMVSVKPPALHALEDALISLARLDPRKAAVVELRFFGGLTLRETAADLRVSPETVSREWRRAKAWLYDELRPHRPESRELSVHRLGAYRLVERLGGGGMGEVYLARRDDEPFDRQVAVKVLRRGLLGTDAQERFESERRILARLEHPGIPRLYDAGVTGDGRPFLVMEKVEGLPIDEYAERNQLPTETLLDLMVSVCAVVEVAHRNRVVHRDLKPGNILIDARGAPRLLDFGIAESQGDEVAEPGSSRSRSPRWVTPSYASPEQVRGEPVTTASDVYSLGVILYELLTERPGEIGVDALASGLAPVRAKRLAPRGPLDAIVMRALEKDPQRRYATAAGLGADLEAYLRRIRRPPYQRDRTAGPDCCTS